MKMILAPRGTLGTPHGSVVSDGPRTRLSAPAGGVATPHPGAEVPRETGAGGSPWYIADIAVQKFERRAKSQRWLPKGPDGYPVRAGRCSWSIGALVSVNKGTGSAHFGQVETCSSVWACPVCASSIRQRRAEEIKQAVQAHQAEGKHLAFMTLTLPHYRFDSLGTSLDALLGCWRDMTAQTSWKKAHPGPRSQAGIKARYGISGVIRATEITYGANGWHPHLHMLVFLERELSETALQALGDEVYTLWAKGIQKRIGRLPSREHGLDIRRVGADGAVLSQYLAKVTDKKSWGVGAEMARGDAKRSGSSITPFQLLDEKSSISITQARALWREYYETTLRRRFMSWSRGLKERYGVDEKDDEQVLAEVQSGATVYLMKAGVYRSLSPTEKAWVLSFATAEDYELLTQLAPGQIVSETEPPDPKPKL